MSKKKEKLAKTYAGIGDANPVRIVTDHVTRQGKFKGSKKEKRALRNVCPHHIITKKGKVKPTIERDGNGNCRCYMCKDIIPLKFADRAEIQKVTGRFYSYVTQAKLMAQSINAGKKAIHQVTDTAILTKMFPGLYNNLANVAQKQDKAKKQKKRNQRYSSGSYGGWGAKR